MAKNIITDVLRLLVETGLCPKIVCDRRMINNQSALKHLNMTEKDPYFFVNGKKVYDIFFTTHVLCLN